MENNNLPNNKQAEDLDKMLAGTTEESAEYDTTQIVEDADKSAKTRNTRIIAGSIIGVILLALLGGLIWWYQASNKPQFSNAQRYASTQNLSNTKADEKSNKARELADFYHIHGNMEIQPYYFKSRNEMTADNKADALKRAMLAFDEGLGVMFPSKTADPNLTDDMSKAYNKDGSMNVKYTYLTKEYVAGTIYDDYQRLLNPVYGGWDDFYTKGDSFTYKDMQNIYAKSGLNKMLNKSLLNEYDLYGFFESIPLRKIVKASTKEDMQKFVKDGLVKYEPRGKLKPSVGQLLGQIKCKYKIQNTDDDGISCEAPIRRVMSEEDDKGQTIFADSKLSLYYKVNHDLSVNNRRLIITGWSTAKLD